MKLLRITLLFLLFSNTIHAQNAKQWMLGGGFTAVDDDCRPLKSVVNLLNGWNALSFPTAVSAEYYFSRSLSLDLAESITTYQVGNIIDGDTVTRGRLFVAGDANAKYHFYTLYKKVQWFDPYLAGGFGMTLRGKLVPTGNFGFGANFWLSKRVAINVQSMAKFSFMNRGTNYLQHCLGVRILF